MSIPDRLVPPGPGFWPQVARLVISAASGQTADGRVPDLSAIRVMVPTFVHVGLLRDALAQLLGASFIPPQSCTPGAWVQQQLPDLAQPGPAPDSERLMYLYAQLRELGWLKKLFAARRNTDLLPLAKTLVALSDELTASLLPAALSMPDEIEDRWRAALARLSGQAAALLSDEAQLVWSIWHGQRDARDPGVARYAQMMRAASFAREPLVWIAPFEPDAFDAAFLSAYAQQQPVQIIRLDWSLAALPAALALCWPELVDGRLTMSPQASSVCVAPASLALHQAVGMEDEAQRAAQTIVNWLQEGKSQIAIVPQDRVVARRLRALLERARVVVSDETGWKLSTTRAAAVLAAWLAVVASGAQTAALLEFLKSPFVFGQDDESVMQLMAIERALVNGNVAGGWHVIAFALAELPAAKSRLDILAREAARSSGRKTIAEWVSVMHENFDALGMLESMQADLAGKQVVAMLTLLSAECLALGETFSLAEWRALINLQLEQTVFIAPRLDQRVVMLPLNGTPLRQFDAAIMLGCDTDHLPSQPTETLFFANAVRRELGLATREGRQQQQLRELSALLLSCPTVVLSWQTRRDGEKNPVSVWIQRLQLALAQAGADAPLFHTVSLPVQTFETNLPLPPKPSAAALLPARLSASGYNSLVACPYQFFATRMLGLSAMDPLSELPQKRDYGNWLHRILHRYHETVQEQRTPLGERGALLAVISGQIFALELEKNPAALGFQARWEKTMPAYLAWANKHEAEGWEFAFGERRMQKELVWDGGSVTLHGRLDRVDRNADGELLVLDYKTTARSSLQTRLERHEDHQLPFYALMTEPQPVGASYVAIDGPKAGTASAEPFDAWRDALHEHIQTNMQALARGAPLPATGVRKSCEWCDVRGLCRKGAW